MSFNKYHISFLLTSGLFLSACNITVDTGKTLTSEELPEDVTVSVVDNSQDQVVNDGQTADQEDPVIDPILGSEEPPSDNVDVIVDGSDSGVTEPDVATPEEPSVDDNVVAEPEEIIDPIIEDPVVLEPVNSSPIANNDQLTTKEDATLSGINLLANDSDADNDSLSLLRFSQPSNGTLDQDANGLLIYTPAANFNGTDEFFYVISDGKGGESSATASILVESVNDLVVVNEELFVNEDDALTNINLLANDTDTDGGTLSILSYSQGTMGGTVEMSSNGSFNYTPAADFHGKDQFNYVVTDGQGGELTGVATVWVASVDDKPVANPDSLVIQQSQSQELALLNNDNGLGDGVTLSLVSNPSNGTVTVLDDGSVVYEPTADYFGVDDFVYKLTDSNGDESIATVSIQVECLANCDQTFALSWDPSVSTGVIGYKVYVGNSPNEYTEILEVGDVTNFEYFTETKGTYYFAVSAINDRDTESDLSEEVYATF